MHAVLLIYPLLWYLLYDLHAVLQCTLLLHRLLYCFFT
jgi:hypothetical protein